MQDLMGNIISGVALQVGKPFQHGDWLLVDSRYAEVIEINWRSTRLRTSDEVSIEIPNRDLAKQTITNLNQPFRLHAMRISVNIDYAAPPTRVKAVLLHAASNAKWVLPSPAPRVFLKNFGDYAVEYEIKFWMDDHTFYNEVCDAIRTNVWYQPPPPRHQDFLIRSARCSWSGPRATNTRRSRGTARSSCSATSRCSNA